VREVFLLAGPRTFSLAAVQIVFFVDTYLASSMPSGSLTALNYAFQLMLLPLGVFSIAISAAVFPTLSHYASLGQAAKMRDALQQAIRWILFLTLPTAIVMVVLRRPIVNLLFQYGAFGAEARELTQATFLFRSEEHTSELQSRENLVCRLLLEKKKKKNKTKKKENKKKSQER